MDYIFLMHALPEGAAGPDWQAYLDRLIAGGRLRGGSAIGDGATFCKAGAPPPITVHLGGYIKVEADSMEAAQALLAGNPVYEAGGVVEIRELPKTG
jgi:hypothetical protein